jgi:hypothetical protein
MFQKINPRMLDREPMRRCCLDECRAACCLHGVWIDSLEAEEIVAHAAEILPHMPAGQQDPAGWFDARREDDPFSKSGVVVHSRVLKNPAHYGGTACAFLRADAKCALQVAADAAGLHPWRYKPFYCVLHPLDLDEDGRITLDETGLLLEEQGSCLRASEVDIPLAETFAPEIRYLAGDGVYEELVERGREV